MTAAETVLKWMREYYEVNGTPNFGEITSQLEMAIEEEKLKSLTPIDGVEEKETIIMPRKLTSENGAKDLLRGEFVECFDPEKTGNSYVVTVSWDNIKRIYEKAVAHFTKNPPQ
jgi:hypothetical protein